MSSQANDFDPEDDEYIRGSLALAVPCIVLGVLVAVSFMLFFLIRFCCCCAGKGCCAKNETPASRKKVFGHCVFALMLLAVTVIGGSMLAASGAPVSDSLGGLADTLIDQVSIFSSNMTSVIETIIDVNPEGSSVDVSELRDGLRELQQTEEQIKDQRETYDRVLQTFEQVVMVIGIFVVICAIKSGLSLVTRKMVLLYMFFLFAMLTCTVTWLLGGVGAIMYVLLDEPCTMMDLHLQGVRNTWLDQNLPCDELREVTTALDTAMETANRAITEANDDIDAANSQAVAAAAAAGGMYSPMPLMCLPYEEVNGQWRETANPPAGCVPMRTAPVQAAYEPRVCDEVSSTQGSLVSDVQYQTCVADNRPLKRDQYESILNAANSFERIAVILPQIQSIAECGFVNAAFEVIVEKDCPELRLSTRMLTRSAILAAAALTIAAFYLCVCVRNVRPQEQPQYVIAAEPSAKNGTAAKFYPPAQQANSAPIMAMV
eukprot:jgi/Ulvmu1/234/UM001_0238.1